MKFFRYTILFIYLTIASCTPNVKEDFEFIIFIRQATERHAEDIALTNQKIIVQLDSLNPEHPIKIGKVRANSFSGINQMEQHLLAYCGGRDSETGALIAPLERKKVKEFFVNQTHGSELKSIINEIIVHVNSQGYDLQNIAFDGDYIKGFESSPWFNKSFSELHFRNITLAGALNVLAIYKAQVAQVENDYLTDKLLEK